MHLPNKIRVDLKKNGATLVEHAKCVECVPNVEAAYNVEAAHITTTSGGTLIRKFFDRYMTSICNTSTLPTFSNHPVRESLKMQLAELKSQELKLQAK